MRPSFIIKLLILMLATTSLSSAQPGFLFVTFKGEKTPMTEQVYFGLSQDGLHWEALNNSEPVLVSEVGKKGARDPFIFRSHDGKKTYLIASNGSINRNPDWSMAVRDGNRSILIWESDDLVHWTGPRLVPIAAEDAGCTWAPEAIYDEEQHDYLVFWASTGQRDDFTKHRIWACRTKDFVTFGEPFLYIEKSVPFIDTDIVRDGQKYIRFSKDEKNKTIFMEVGDKLMGPWSEVPNFSLAHMAGYEGPECFLLHPSSEGKPPVWCLMLDHYGQSAGYEFFVTSDLASGQFMPVSEISFPFHFRHGSVLPVTAAEYQSLQDAYKK